MAKDDFRRIINASEFPLLQGPLEAGFDIFKAQINALDLNNEIGYFELVDRGGAVLFYWDEYPGEDDLADVQAVVDAFVGGTTSDAPIVSTNAGPVTASNATPVTVIDVTSPPLAAGTYQVVVSCQMRMQAEVAGDAARAILTITTPPASAPPQQEHWGFAVNHAYNAVATFNRQAGQTIQVQLQIAEVGPGAGVAEITNARVTIDKIS